MKSFWLAILLLLSSVLIPASRQTSTQNAQPGPQSSTASSPPVQNNPQLGLQGLVPAEDVFKDIEIFKGKGAERVLPAMEAISGSLGVPCQYCHTQFEWEKSDKQPKQTTRKMFRMIGFINEKYFPGQNKVSCWTCHHGHPEQGHPSANAPQLAQNFIHLDPADADKPAEQVFHNIQSLKGVPAGRLPLVMNFFSNSLGVDCSHCHVPNQWEKEDKEAKQTARKMLSMVHDIIHTFYGNQGQIGCFGCHEGAIKPELVASQPGK